MDVRTASAMIALAVVAVGTAWWIFQPPDTGTSTATSAREPTAMRPGPRPLKEPAKLRRLTDVGMVRPARPSLQQPSSTSNTLPARSAEPNHAAEDGVQSERFAALIDRARDTIWMRGEELGLPESDIQATVARVETYLKRMDDIRTEVRAGQLDRRVAKDQLTTEREALHDDLDALVGPETHQALKGAIPAKY